MSDKTKNKLQEYCQKNGWDLPKYETHCSGQSHDPIFVSQVIVNGQTYMGNRSNSKKGAEKLAADVAYFNLMEEYNKNKINYLGPRITILLDIENQPKFIENLEEYINLEFNNLIRIEIFVSLNSPLKNKKYNEKYCTMHMIPVVRSDAADTYLIFRAGMYVACRVKSEYIIVSNDHFAETLKEIMRFSDCTVSSETNLDNIITYIKYLHNLSITQKE